MQLCGFAWIRYSPSTSQPHSIVLLQSLQLFSLWSMQWISFLPVSLPPYLSHHCLDRHSAGTKCAELSSGAMQSSESHAQVVDSLLVTLLSFVRASSTATLCYHKLTELSDYQSFLLVPLILLYTISLLRSLPFPVVYAFHIPGKLSLPIN